jgi:hypothetical protein
MAPHGIDGWYVGPSIERYDCHKCYIPSTFGIHDALTVDWFPHKVPFPKVTADKYLRQTATNMLTLIQDKASNPIPSLTYGSNISNAYIQIAQILKCGTATPKQEAPNTPVPEPRVPLATPPASEQRVLAPIPTTVTPVPKKNSATGRPLPRRGPPRPGRRSRVSMSHPKPPPATLMPTTLPHWP